MPNWKDDFSFLRFERKQTSEFIGWPLFGEKGWT
jgi:hypothetical protein